MSLIVPIKSHRPLIVCPATDDGLAASAILNRTLSNPVNTLYLRENGVAEIFSYPAVREHKDDIELVLAGFTFPETLTKLETEKLPRRISWYSHHYWPKSGYEFAGRAGVELAVCTDYPSTSRLIIDRLKIRDATSVACAEQLSEGRLPADPFWQSWFYASLALRDDLYGIRLSLAPLFAAGQAPEASGEMVASGRNMYETFADGLSSGRTFQFAMTGNLKACTMGIPASMTMYFRTLGQIAFQRFGCSLVVMVIDGSDQVTILRDERTAAEVPTMLISAMLDDHFGKPTVRLYDRNTMAVTPEGSVIAAVEKITSGLTGIFSKVH